MANRKSFMKNALDAMVNARSRQAAAYVNGALLMLDDKTLEAQGYSRKELQGRRGSYYPF